MKLTAYLIAAVVAVGLFFLFRPLLDPKVLMIYAITVGRNHQPQDFYGKVMDQYGKPVQGVTAIGVLIQDLGIGNGEKQDTYTTLSDNDGNFQFTGLRGWQLGVVVKKQGYDGVGKALGVYQAPNDQDKSSPLERAVFHVWKLKGAEPMARAKVHAYIPCDGTTETYNLVTGKGKGDLQVTLTRTPVNIDRGKPFDWTLTVGIANGGLLPETDPYPYEAPASGYRPVDTINMPATDKDWSPDITRTYYFMASGGQTYGRMTIQVTASFQPPPTLFDADIYANPAGSRNLEYDPAKQINP